MSRRALLVVVSSTLVAGCIVVPADGRRSSAHVETRAQGQVAPASPDAYPASPAPAGYPAASTPPSGLVSKPVATGENHVCALEHGDVHCWGNNYKGTLGLGTTAEPASGVVPGLPHDLVQVVAGDYHTCVLSSTRAMWCWGYNGDGELGQGQATDTPINTPQPVREDHIRSIFAGPKSTCLQKDDGSVHCWGQNTVGAILPATANGPPVLTPTHVPALDGADDLAIGDYAICALRAGKVNCTGWLAQVDLHGLPQVTSLTAGWGHACAVAGGQVHCWGRNFQGALGFGDPCASQPGPDARSACLIKDADVVYPPRVVPGLGEAVTQVADTCALGASGAVICWGGRGQNLVTRGQQEPFRSAHTLAGIDHVSQLHAGDTFYCFTRGGQLSCAGQPWSPQVSATITP